MKIVKNRDIESATLVKIFKNQIFEEIVHDAKFNGQKFIDSEYSSDNKIIFYSKNFEFNIPWNRPSDLTRRPCLLREGPKCCTNMIIRESKMKNFISVCGALSRNLKYLDQIVPNLNEQKSRYNENSENNPGAFHFFFWKFGTVWDVTIDDLLPISLTDKKPLYSFAEDYSEFWVSLLEKAYAKFNNGDYESLKKRTIGEMLVDLTSGVYEAIMNIQKETSLNSLFTKLNKSLLAKDLIIFSFTLEESDNAEAKRSHIKRYKDDEDNGYTLTEIVYVHVKPDHENFFDKKDYCLLKFFSPWRYFNYDGPWSSSSKEWLTLMNNIREEYGLALDTSCEFLMPFEYAVEYFTIIHILHNPENLFITENKIVSTPTYGLNCRHKWTVDYKIVDKNRAGKPCPELFLYNSQYRFDVKSSPATSVVFALQQEKVRFKGDFDEKNLKNVIFFILKIEDNRVYRCHMHYQNILTKINLGSARDVYLEFEPEENGRYLFIPCNEKSHYSTEYLLRVYSNKNINFRELKYDTPNELFPHNALACLRYNLGTILVLHELNFTGFDDKEKFNDETSILVEMTCEGTRYRKIMKSKSNNMNFDKSISAIFYRKNFTNPIQVNIELINKEKLGFFRIQNVESDEINQVYILNLILKNKKSKIKSIRMDSNAIVSIYNRETLMKI